MDSIRIFNIILALAVIYLNVKWWRRAANRKFGEIIIAPVFASSLIIAFVLLTLSGKTDPIILNGISLGIRSYLLIILLIYAAYRRDHGNGK
jgi:hypothetical protein